MWEGVYVAATISAWGNPLCASCSPRVEISVMVARPDVPPPPAGPEGPLGGSSTSSESERSITGTGRGRFNPRAAAAARRISSRSESSELSDGSAVAAAPTGGAPPGSGLAAGGLPPPPRCQSVRSRSLTDGDPFAAAFVLAVVGAPGHVTGAHLDLLDLIAPLEVA